MIKYTTRDLSVNDRELLEITLEKYPNSPFVIGRVSFEEVDGKLNLSYNYDIVGGEVPKDIKEFERHIGDLIVTFIKDNPEELVYAGGT